VFEFYRALPAILGGKSQYVHKCCCSSQVPDQ
jgi:hypothetical protein